MLSLYRNICKLGEGGFGNVYLFEHTINGEKVAAKFMDVSEYLRKANEIKNALKESTSLISLDHAQIIRFETAFLLNSEIVLFTEYMQGGELGQYIKTNKINEKQAKQIFKLILEAVNYCHTHGIIHRDLKMENILLKDSKDPLSLKIIDFGIAGLWSKCGGEISAAGTLYYTPPEVISETDLHSDPKIDIWALGVILYIMLCGTYPFKSEVSSSETRNQILHKEVTFTKRNELTLSKEVKHLLYNLLEKDKTKRYSIREIISHPWMEEVINLEDDKTPLLSLTSGLINQAIKEEIEAMDSPTLSGKNTYLTLMFLHIYFTNFSLGMTPICIEGKNFQSVIENHERLYSINLVGTKSTRYGPANNEIRNISPRKLTPIKLKKNVSMG